MKKISTILIATIVVFSIPTFARALIEAKKDVQTFYYHGATWNPSDLNNPANYSTSPGSGISCGGNGLLCSIMDEDNGNGQPSFSNGTLSQSNYSSDYSGTRRQ